MIATWLDLFYAMQSVHPWSYESQTTRRCQVCGRVECLDSMSLYLLDFERGEWVLIEKGNRDKHMN